MQVEIYDPRGDLLSSLTGGGDPMGWGAELFA